MCASSGEVELVTKSRSDTEGVKVIYDKMGKVTNKTTDTSIKPTGTSISVKRIFEPQPVRLEVTLPINIVRILF
jgi:DNA mismatch repair ATPase MutL